MSLEILLDVLKNFGFPIFSVVALGFFVFYKDKRYYDSYLNELTRCADNFNSIRESSQKREDKLYDELAKNREINEKAIRTIALYAERLDNIQSDIEEIKTDVTILRAKTK